MNIEFDFNGNNFMAGAIFCAALTGLISIYWALSVPFILVSLEIKGMPFAKLSYKSGVGWKLTTGRYT